MYVDISDLIRCQCAVGVTLTNWRRPHGVWEFGTCVQCTMDPEANGSHI